MTLDRTLLAAELRRDEGWRPVLYDDATGHPIARGSHVVGAPTIGVGRNLAAHGLSDDEIALLLANDITIAEAELDIHWPWWRTLDPVRQRVMANLCFNLGAPRLSGFTRFLTAAQAGDYAKAADEMADSLWARQVGARATRLIAMMRDGATDAPIA